MNNIVNFRNIWTTFYKNICLLDSNNDIINNKFVLFFLNNISYYFLINGFILKQLKINYLYKIDSLYFYENYLPKNNFIFPIIYNFKLDSKKCMEMTSTILKYIVHLLVLERKIKVNNEQQPEFLKESDALIDACVGLLSFPKSIKIKGCLKRFLN